MNFKTIIAISSLLVFYSCKKEIIEIPDSNKPVFTVEGTVGNSKVKFVVGDDLSTFETKNELLNGINFFKGIIRYQSEEIELGFFNGDNDISNGKLEDIITKTNLVFAESTNDPLFYVTKNYFSNSSSIKEIKWFVDNEYAGTNSLTINSPGKYMVCAEISYSNLPKKTICNEVIVGFKKNANFELKHTIQSGNQLTAFLDGPTNPSIKTVKWFVDDTLVSEDLTLNTIISENVNTIKAEIEFSNGSKRTRSILVDGTNSNASFEDFVIYENTNGPIWDYKMKINLLHLGEEYTSVGIDNSDAIFEISSVTPFGFDEPNNSIYVFKGILKAQVISKETNQILDVNLKISWGIEIK